METGDRKGMIENAVLIAGPTASGKSGLAADIARRIGGVVVNADSMQVYSTLRILTARPSEAEAANPPHYLYGHVDPAIAHSTGAWLRDVAGLARTGLFERRRPVFVGGTGLYFSALMKGLPDFPEIPPSVREKWRHALAGDGAARLHSVLAERDPAAARGINPTDGQRIVRALEVCEVSGGKFSDLRASEGSGMVDMTTMRGIVLEPKRQLLRERIENRLRQMVRDGALDEVDTLLRRGLDPDLPAMKAIGVRELARYLAGEFSLDEAIQLAVIATRQYAKRQSTWFRHQIPQGFARIASPAEWTG
ncbi:MAG: tRNA (adenosine(37)-N6)-dimethylallyltransferase MiaA [Rhizobiaceae bacterium]|nr:tRNA (adenosine(37)-N6)-dimethylallyltransferase MiaA [Rhizobiaceae bacterium]MCV0408762.1 tRNA (adenosine(37)-N6)-dimethylallyltransferase MiaA [Rhizobiaceae bacterium]